MPSATFSNPIASQGVTDFLETILGTIMYLGMPIIGLVLIYAGFMFISARGNSEKVHTATLNITYVIIGIALVLGSYTIGLLFYDTIVIGILGWK